MKTRRDYYGVLGVSRDATQDEIKRAFRKLAFECHPDHNNEDGAGERFKEVNEAYEVLSDPNRRAKYDGFEYEDTAWFGQGFEGYDNFINGFGDIFEAFFGTSTTTGRRTARRGSDLHHSISISFEEAFFGCEKKIEVIRTEECSLCCGHGGKTGSQAVRCPDCGGTGQVRRMQQSIFGRFVNVVTCERCLGEGGIFTEACSQCRGTGKERQLRKIMVRVPAGVENGSQICLSGEGEAGLWGGNPGSLYVSVTVSSHESFRREGSDIIYELPLNFAQAALGDEIEVPIIGGNVTLKIPPGTQTGKVFRLKNKGFPYLHHSGRGDQLVEIQIVTPRDLTKEQRRLFEELSRSLGSTRVFRGRGDRGFLDRLRGSFGGST